MKGRMFYSSFDDNITAKHDIIIKNWPLPVFCSPGDIRTVTEIKILYNAWNSGTTHFYKLTTSEATEWLNKQLDESVAGTSGPETCSPSSPPHSARVSTPSASAPPAQTSTPTEGPDRSPDLVLASDLSTEQRMPHQPIDPVDSIALASELSSEQRQAIVPVDSIGQTTHEPTNATATSPTIQPLSSMPVQPEPAGTTAGGTKRALDTDIQPRKRHRQGIAPAFINNTIVTSIDGATVVMSKKSRKERSDKGTKRKRT